MRHLTTLLVPEDMKKKTAEALGLDVASAEEVFEASS